jgi:hypothetical protein
LDLAQRTQDARAIEALSFTVFAEAHESILTGRPSRAPMCDGVGGYPTVTVRTRRECTIRAEPQPHPECVCVERERLWRAGAQSRRDATARSKRSTPLLSQCDSRRACDSVSMVPSFEGADPLHREYAPLVRRCQPQLRADIHR